MQDQQTEFYKYAYTELLHRNLLSSCDAFIAQNEQIQKVAETLLKDIQDYVYNIPESESNDVRDSSESPKKAIEVASRTLIDAISIIQRYKLELLSNQPK